MVSGVETENVSLCCKNNEACAVSGRVKPVIFVPGEPILEAESLV